jgi:hypothetical protein
MLNLYWKTNGQTRNLIDKPFPSETELEDFIDKNQDLLGDVYVFSRQVITGQKQGIPDMLGVDQDGRICIIELKNQTAEESILPQALGYAIWVETNPDSIKAIWLEHKHKQKNIVIDLDELDKKLNWDKLEIRAILIAPSFKLTVPRMAPKMGYRIELVQIRRYAFEDNEFVSVEIIEEAPQPKIISTKTGKKWDWEFYESEHGKEATGQFQKTVELIAAYAKKQGWELPSNINKYYTGFKLGSKVVFSVGWGGTRAWKIYMKLPKDLASGFKGKNWEFQAYNDVFGEAVFRPLNPQHPSVTELEGFFLEAFKRVSGTTS